jgi:CheY-like chemotaxis protein
VAVNLTAPHDFSFPLPWLQGSSPELGTSFASIPIDRVSPPQAGRRRAVEAHSNIAMTLMTQSGGSRKQFVLAIDDEQAIRAMLQAALPIGGFEVLLAATGLEGIELFKRRREDIGVVLLDLCMPGLSGIETCKRLRELDPDVPVCFMTGYTFDEIGADPHAFHAPLLQKPFGLPALFAALRRLIETRAPVNYILI